MLQVLSDSIKKRDYDEQLRKEESRTRSVCQRSHSTSHQVNNVVLLIDVIASTSGILGHCFLRNFGVFLMNPQHGNDIYPCFLICTFNLTVPLCQICNDM